MEEDSFSEEENTEMIVPKTLYISDPEPPLTDVDIKWLNKLWDRPLVYEEQDDSA